MGEPLSATGRGSAPDPIKYRKGEARKITFVFRDQPGRQRRIQLVCHNFVELIRSRQRKASNEAETEGVITVEYTSRLIKIRGNKEALDRIESLEDCCHLSRVQLSEGADPDNDEGKLAPVVYSVELVKKDDPKVALQSESPLLVVEPLSAVLNGSGPGPLKARKSTRKVTFVIGDKDGVKLRLQLASRNFIELVRSWEPNSKTGAGLEDVITMKYTTRFLRIRGNRAALDRLESIEDCCELGLVKPTEGADPARDEGKPEPVVYSVEAIEPANKKKGKAL